MSQRVSTGDSWITTYVSGPAVGTPVLLVSGFIGVASFWEGVQARLATTRPVLRFDQRGTGASGPFTAPLSVEQMASDAERVLLAQGVQVAHVVGHSAGAGAALILAARRPELVRSLTLVAGWARADSWMRRAFEARLQALDASREAYVRLTTLFMVPPADVSEHEPRILANEAQSAAQLPASDEIRARAEAVLAFDASQWAPAIDCRTMVLGAADDMMTPRHHATALARALPGARSQELADGGHYAVATRAAEISRVCIEFLDAIEAEAGAR